MTIPGTRGGLSRLPYVWHAGQTCVFFLMKLTYPLFSVGLLAPIELHCLDANCGTFVPSQVFSFSGGDVETHRGGLCAQPHARASTIRKHLRVCLEEPEYRVVPRLGENQVPGAGYPARAGPEPDRSKSATRGYLCPGYPGTRVPGFTIYGAPENLLHTAHRDTQHTTHTILLPAAGGPSIPQREGCPSLSPCAGPSRQASWPTMKKCLLVDVLLFFARGLRSAVDSCVVVVS